MLSSDMDRVNFLYVNIGRGHPFYLDGVTEALIRKGSISLVRAQPDVFELTSGLSQLSWRAVRWLYKRGASEGGLGWFYRRLRNNRNYARNSFPVRLLGMQLRAWAGQDDSPVIVSHPLLVGILKGHRKLFYQHGEVVAPPESIVPGAEVAFVPLEQTAALFEQGGYDKKKIVVTGLCIEPALVRQAEDTFGERMKRINGTGPLTGAFFSSGAEPKEHILRIVEAVTSVVDNRERALVFAFDKGRLQKAIAIALKQKQLPYHVITSAELIPLEFEGALVIVSSSRREENMFTARFFPRADYFVAPSHERSNWALGLGLPLFILDPPYGPFAPLNRKMLLEREVALTISTFSEAANCSRWLQQLRYSGRLSQMALNGRGKLPINGFEKIADFFVSQLSGNEL